MTSWLVVTGILLIILLTYQIARVLERAAEYQYPQGVVLELIWLGVLQYLSIVMPIGLLLGVLLAFGRLYHDSEMAAAQACGVGPSRIYGPVAVLALLVTGLIAYLTLVLGPATLGRTLALRSEALRAGQFAPISPGKFRTFGGTDVVVYAQGAEPDGTLTNVFVEREREGRVEVALAARARHTVGEDARTHTITLYEGEQFEGVPGSAQFRVMRFAEQVIPIEVPPADDAITSLEAAPTRELLASDDLKHRAELHRRFSLPIMCMVLTLVAVPLSRLRPRQGRYARIWLGVVIYFVYANLVEAGKVWIERGVVPEALGLWWTHLAVVLLAILVIMGPKWLARLRYRG